MPPAAFLHPQNAQKSSAASPQTPLEELTALPRPLAGLRGVLLREGEKEGGKGIGGKERGRRYFGPSQCWKQIDATNQLCVEWDVKLYSLTLSENVMSYDNSQILNFYVGHVTVCS